VQHDDLALLRADPAERRDHRVAVSPGYVGAR
jgi:hypothetical protein